MPSAGDAVSRLLIGRVSRLSRTVAPLLATVIGAAVLAMSGGADAKPRGSSAVPSLASKQSYLEKVHAAGAPGAIARVRIGSEVWSGAVGFADKARTIRVHPDMVWRVASVTKLVAAHIVLALDREGVLSISDPLGRHNAHLPSRYRALKIRALLDQSSRVSEYLDYDVFGMTARTMLRSIGVSDLPEHALNAALARAWFVDEMAEHQYANTNYVLLQHAMEQASGASFADLLAWHVINPLGLKKTGLVGPGGKMPTIPHLRAYIRDDDGEAMFGARDRLLDVTHHHFLMGADGGLYSNAEELAKMMDFIWANNKRDGLPLGAMTPTLKADHDGMYRYGYGVMAVTLTCGRVVYGHEGLDLGSVTQAFADRENRRQLIMATNISTDQNNGLDDAIRRMRDAVFCGR